MAQRTPPAVFFWSVWYLRPSMIYWRVHRAVKGLLLRAVERAGLTPRFFMQPEDPVPHRIPPRLSSRVLCEDMNLPLGRFSFLRDTLTLPTDRDARRAAVARMPLLWQFHYGYHDYLVALLQRDDPVDVAHVRAFLAQWSEDHPLHAPGSRASAWHPYVLSLRIDAWIRLSRLLDGDDVKTETRTLLARGIAHMTRVLLHNLERGTMANHFLKNIKALVLAGLFLDSPAGARALRKGLRLLRTQLAEQVLEDGMHFERSPMYHAAMTSDVLDLVEALEGSGHPVPAWLSAAAVRMTAFLAHSRHPDGEIAFFNDSTSSFFLSTQEVVARGERICGDAQVADARSRIDSIPTTEPRHVSGLMLHRSADLFLAFDAGQVGPDYQPGHAHCDTLSYELSWKGKRLVSDTGVLHYRESPERSYARSTAAHSTVRIDGIDQSEVWKSFRVGRRADIVYAERRIEQGCAVFSAAHDGYARIERGLLHERCIVIRPDEWICVLDFIHGASRRLLENVIHLHPDWQVHSEDPRTVAVRMPGLSLRIRALRDESRRLFATDYYPAFGVCTSRRSIVLHSIVRLPYVTGYLLLFPEAVRQPVVTLHDDRAHISDGKDLALEITSRVS